MMQYNRRRSVKPLICIIFCVLLLASYGTINAQDNKQVIRIAKLQIDAVQLDKYKVMLKESIETSVRVEPGVLTYYAVSDKKSPTNITILEVYASPEAYKSHIETPHFKKYKAGTKDMVKSLELVDVDPVVFATKQKQ
jgi:quinol monooxygenase YgiN